MRKIFVLVFLLLFAATLSYAQKLWNDLEKRLGVVSYTYRKSFQKDVAATLDTIKSVGFNNIEISNLFGKTAAEFRSLLDQKGIKCTSFGVSYPDITTKIDEVGSNAKALGASFVRVAWVPHDNNTYTLDDAKKTVSDFNTAGKILKEKYGLSFCYHNHGYEFVKHENGTLFDYIVANTNPDYVNFELDILWAKFPGVSPEELLKKHGSRFKLMHLKDLRKGVQGDFSGKTDVNNDVALGTGQIDIPGVLKAARKADVAYYYIEDESDFVKTQVPQTLAFLKKQ